MPESAEELLEAPQNRDRDEEDPDGRMIDLLPAPEDDYSDESDAEVDAEETGVENPEEPELDVHVTSNTEGDLASHLGSGSNHRRE